MSRPSRNSTPDAVRSSNRIFFITAKTSLGRNLLQSERNAKLLIDVLRSLVIEKKFRVRDFVIMNHIHLLIDLSDGITVEKAMQFVKGRFSYRMSHEIGYMGEIWQRGFSEVRVLDHESFEEHCKYIAANPVKAGLANEAKLYPYCYRFLVTNKRPMKDEQGLKPV